MKVRLLLTAILSASALSAQIVEVKEKTKVQINEPAYNPVLDNTGKKILFTTENYKGLKLYDLSENTQQTITSENGAGYKPIFTNDGNEVYYKKTSYKGAFRHDALFKTNLKQNKQEEVIAPSRSLKAPIAMKDGVAVASEGILLKTGKAQQPYATIEDNKIALYEGNHKTILQPCGDNVIGYVWPSISPDGSKILFHCAGKGTFVSDLKGNVLAQLGPMVAPVWYTNDFVVGMIEENDGRDYTASKIVISSVDGKMQKDLTDKSEIAMFPSVSLKSNNIVYNTLDGEVFILTLNVKK